jgi:hypothetical protein
MLRPSQPLRLEDLRVPDDGRFSAHRSRRKESELGTSEIYSEMCQPASPWDSSMVQVDL